MNVTMLAQQTTQRNLQYTKDDGFTVLGVEDGWQACGAVGLGRMPETQTLISALVTALK
jgi:phosphopantothenoylcysteine decarboxylase/phosphopantothenate--cysteine ligase